MQNLKQKLNKNKNVLIIRMSLSNNIERIPNKARFRFIAINVMQERGW